MLMTERLVSGMRQFSDLALTALAPAVWGSTYLVTTEFLPDGYPVTVSLLRALPAGLLLLLIVRKLPARQLWRKITILGALNFAVFFPLLFLSAYRLPGGVAATVIAIQPLIVIGLARVFLRSPVYALSLIAAIAGLLGVALLVIGPEATLDPIGLLAGFGAALCMAAGVVLSRKWQPPVSLMTFTAWQMTAGGLLLLPMAIFLEPPLPELTSNNLLGLAYLGLIGGALTYFLWFRGISRLEPSAVSVLIFLSPLTAIGLGWSLLDQHLSLVQISGAAIVLASVWVSQRGGTKENGDGSKPV